MKEDKGSEIFKPPSEATRSIYANFVGGSGIIELHILFCVHGEITPKLAISYAWGVVLSRYTCTYISSSNSRTGRWFPVW